MVDFSDMDMSFDLGEPFKPFEQLLAVLPAASAECLPQPLRVQMTCCHGVATDIDFWIITLTAGPNVQCRISDF